MTKKKVIKKSIKDKFNVAYEKMQSSRMKERAGKGCKNGCNCER